MSEIAIKQAHLSEQLLLLREFGFTYAEPQSPLPFPRSIQVELELLDAVATVLTSRRGESFAAALDKNNGFVKVILAKSPGRPTIDDKAFAKDFFAFVVDPTTKNATDVFSFVLKHRRDYLNMRIKKLHAISTDDKFNQYFRSHLDRCVERGRDFSLKAQFPKGHSRLDQSKDFGSLLKECLLQTQLLSADDLKESLPDAHQTFFDLIIFSETLASSAFMQELKSDSGRSIIQKKAGKFVRHVEKLGRYVHGIKRLLKHAKRLSPSGSVIPHRWVEESYTGTGEGEIQFYSKNAYELICNYQGNISSTRETLRKPWQILSI